MKTVPLHGKHANGRMALVDDADYEMVSRYRWYLHEVRREGRISGPYARTSFSRRDHGGKAPAIFMHQMIMGLTGVDHADHDTLNNQRYNLRPATSAQNGANRRKRSDARSSIYKGVSRRGGKWRAAIGAGGTPTYLGNFAEETSAAYAYDLAAREIFGAFACTNFPADPPQEVLEKWRAEPEAQQAVDAEVGRAHGASMSEWWKQQEPETRACVVCGGKYQSRARRSLYCSGACKRKLYRERKQEGRLFLGARYGYRREHRVLHA